MDELKENIDRQIESNKGKNLFADDTDNSLRFLQKTVIAIERTGALSDGDESVLIDYVTNKVLEEFCRINQYFSFDKESVNNLKAIYTELFRNLKHKNSELDSISHIHFQNLKTWFRNSNAFAKKIYSSGESKIQPVACSEYGAELQLEILQIDYSVLMEPVLDIGCGKKGELVRYFRGRGIEAYGIDRFSGEDSYLAKSDWLEYEYGINKWGTLTSNLGFSNHFNHHHMRDDGDFVAYAKKYMDILNSLKTGGSFHYAPDLPFIEKYLDNDKYLIRRQNIGRKDFKTTIIKRIK